MLPQSVQAYIDAEVAAATTDYSDLRAVYLNGTLKPSPAVSHTDALVDVSAHVLRGAGARVDVLRTVDHVVAPGVQKDMREHGFERDDWPDLFERFVAPADIVVLATPTWLGDQSSQTRLVVERLYAYSGVVNDRGQWAYYGKVGSVIVTGNEDGGKHCAAQLLYALSHLGLTVPPQADTYWNGEAGPGPSYLDEGSGGPQNHWTTRNTVFAAWNVLHLARMLKDAGGIPAHGNDTRNWDLSQPDHPNPEYRA